MHLDANDLAVIEQALKEGLNAGTSYQTAMHYRGVLNKLQSAPYQEHPQVQPDSSDDSPASTAEVDGFRYDYDDNAT